MKTLRTAAALLGIALLAGPGLASAGAAPVPANFGPIAFAATSNDRWWVLGSAPCKSPPCTAILASQNAGRSFSALPAPKTGEVHGLRFADPKNGFAFGPELWSTHNGAGSWKQVNVGGSVVNLVASGGRAYALVRTASGTGRLFRSPVGRDDWHPIGNFAGYPFAGLWAQGATVIVETQDRKHASVLISKDSGDHFTVVGHPPPSVACQLQGPLPVVWAYCATGNESGVWRSLDGGRDFRGVGGDATRSGVPPEPNSAAFVAPTPTAAVYGYEQLWRTADAGAHWSRIPGTRGAIWWMYLGFTDATHGVALGQFQGGYRLYRTIDGGQSYRRVLFRA